MKAWFTRRVDAMVDGFSLAVLAAVVYELIRYPNGRPTKAVGTSKVRHNCSPTDRPAEKLCVRIIDDSAGLTWTGDHRYDLTTGEAREAAQQLRAAASYFLSMAARG